MHDKSDQLDTLFLIFYDRRFGFFPPLPSPWKNASSLSSPSELLLLVIWASELFFPTNFHVTTWLPFSFVTLFNGGVAWHKRNLKFGLSAHDIRGEREAVVSLIHDGELCKKWFFNAQTSSIGSQGHTFSIVYGRNFGFSSVHHEFTHTSKVETNTTDCHHFFVKL